ncbi:hypothetical protein SAMN04488095_1020 [Jannaschia pohangensis]|uniref:Uncharacterized protein n=2 Tax=Jannaschia pohangensis TaxID=390807 RepID=A0A1I3ILL4_9RHOB|nr:hypothetical protein SAMN04488095_1020 [Jannaschia pohangensis]
MGIGPVGAGALIAVLAAGLWASLYLGPNASVSRRVILPFVLRVAFPMAVLLGVPLLVVGQVVDLEDRLWQALIAGGVIATGWLATAVFGEIERATRKAERTRDFHKALYAEVLNTLEAIWGKGEAEAQGQALLERMEEEPDFVPFIPREHHDRVFVAQLDDIDVLPRQTIDAVVAYYSQVAAIAALVEDMRGDRFQHLSQPRRIAMVADYLDLRRRTFVMGKSVLRLIHAYAEGGPAKAEALAKTLSSPGADPSGPAYRDKG